MDMSSVRMRGAIPKSPLFFGLRTMEGRTVGANLKILLVILCFQITLDPRSFTHVVEDLFLLKTPI